MYHIDQVFYKLLRLDSRRVEKLLLLERYLFLGYLGMLAPLVRAVDPGLPEFYGHSAMVWERVDSADQAGYFNMPKR